MGVRIDMTQPLLENEHIRFQIHGELRTNIRVKSIAIKLTNHMRPVDLSMKIIVAIREAIQELENEFSRA